MAKRYEGLTISDDFIFGKTMGDKVLCHDVLERMLEKRVGTLEDIQPQREFSMPWMVSRCGWICMQGIGNPTGNCRRRYR